MSRCVNCDREACDTLDKRFYTINLNSLAACTADTWNAWRVALADCKANTHDWRAEAIAARDRDRWIQVAERLPEHGRQVLCSDGVACTVGNFRGPATLLWWTDNRAWVSASVTHWRPLPSPPESKEASNKPQLDDEESGESPCGHGYDHWLMCDQCNSNDDVLLRALRGPLSPVTGRK